MRIRKRPSQYVTFNHIQYVVIFCSESRNPQFEDWQFSTVIVITTTYPIRRIFIIRSDLAMHAHTYVGVRNSTATAITGLVLLIACLR